MSHKHENLLRAIFHDPVSGNIQWREAESLLRHLGATIEQLSGARIRVRLNGVEDTLHRPHHGDALGRQDIYHLREYLAAPGSRRRCTRRSAKPSRFAGEPPRRLSVQG